MSTDTQPDRSRPLSSGAVLHSWFPSGETRANLVLQHGMSEYAERYFIEYSQIGRQLVERGIAVHGIDMVGHGSAKGPRGRVDLYRAVGDHVKVRSIVAQDGLPLLVLGHSLGGLVTTGSLVRSPLGVHGAVIMSPAIMGPTPRAARRWLRGVARLVPGAPAPVRQLPLDNLTSRKDVRERSDADPRMSQTSARMIVGSSVLDVSAEIWRKYPNWQAPALFVHGEIDQWTNPRWSRELVERINRDDVVRVEVADGRHELLHDADSESTVALVLGWIEDRLRLL